MNIRRNPGKGFTLLEVIITSALLTFLLGSLLWVIVAGKCAWQASVTRSAVRQDLQVACRKISLDLRDCNLQFITNSTTDLSGGLSAFSVLSAVDRDGRFVTSDADGSPTWKKYVVYYIPAGKTKLLRREVYGNFSGALGAQELAAYCDGSGVTISGCMTSLRIVTGASGKAVTLMLQASAVNRHGGTDVQSLETTVTTLN